jgi:hypothetical protein
VSATKNRKKSDEFPPSDGVRVKGFFRINIEEDGEIVGDSGWVENMITNTGFQNYICGPMSGTTGSSSVAYMALGTGTAPASTDNSIQGEISGGTKRTTMTQVGTATNRSGVQWTATFNSTATFVTTTSTIQNVGLFGHSSTNSLCAGNTYGTSSCATNQNVNVSYVISFS